MPTVEDLLDVDVLGECIVCKPFPTARNMAEEDLCEWAMLGGPEDLAWLAEENETTMTFRVGASSTGENDRLRPVGPRAYRVQVRR